MPVSLTPSRLPLWRRIRITGKKYIGKDPIGMPWLTAKNPLKYYVGFANKPPPVGFCSMESIQPGLAKRTLDMMPLAYNTAIYNEKKRTLTVTLHEVPQPVKSRPGGVEPGIGRSLDNTPLPAWAEHTFSNAEPGG